MTQVQVGAKKMYRLKKLMEKPEYSHLKAEIKFEYRSGSTNPEYSVVIKGPCEETEQYDSHDVTMLMCELNGQSFIKETLITIAVLAVLILFCVLLKWIIVLQISLGFGIILAIVCVVVRIPVNNDSDCTYGD